MENLKITLEAARVNAGMTQVQVCEKSGFSKPSLIAWEKGKKKIKPYQLTYLCDLYNVSPDNIFLPITLTNS